MRTPRLRPSVELPMGKRNAVLGRGDACEHPHWGHRWSPPMGLRNAALGGGTAYGHPHWGLRWSSPWGYETVPWVGEPHAGTPTGAF
eukprot:2413915-Pyramimonas_sp.AAC.1